ncbi:ketopantoate reductase family protein [Phreatobacter stygius]|uniref:2-dehydropantoate 2-reductase n=1 Tax=Phreatobacter stygius TaxID=1940610 RepID=A0A4D7B7B3_9HYPH|nr:ketopantoate reductase family protein [Phreatobacter stygius]QCI66248.1 ketopantoate reductase family protein [Phreatobacter stygius]
MQILILGAGGIGGYFGGRLAAASTDVTFLVRRRRAVELARDGLVIRSPCGDLRMPVKAVERATRPFDLVVLACKAYDLEAADEAVAPAVGPKTVILPLLNGLRHLAFLDARFASSQVLGGLCHIGVTVNQAGEIEHLNELHELTLGARAEAQAGAADAIHAALARGGVGPRNSATISQDMWEKFVFLASYAGITCCMRAPIGAVARTDDGAALTIALLEECAAVAGAAGFRPRPDFMARARASLTDRSSNGTSSMLRDIWRGAPTEHDHILGDLLSRAAEFGLATPILRIVRAHLQAYAATPAISHVAPSYS